jgi:hypothetical protein
MTKEENAGLLRAAKACGLSEADCKAIADGMSAPIKLSELTFGQATAWEKALTYALACWLSQMDGSLNAAERDSLIALGNSLQLPDLKLKAAASAAFDIACLPGGHKPERYDFAALEEHQAAVAGQRLILREAVVRRLGHRNVQHLRQPHELWK